MTGQAKVATPPRDISEPPPSNPPHHVSCIVITSPGTIDMAAITALAKALKRPVVQLAQAIYHAPTVLIKGLAPDKETELLHACQQLGMDVEAQPEGRDLEEDTARFDVAACVRDPAAIPTAIEVISRVVGVSSEQAYTMLSTPPGSILGDISTAAADSLTQRFGAGIQVTASPSHGSLFDLHVSRDCPRTSEIDRLCGEQRGLVTVGLTEAAATDIANRVPKGAVRLVPRSLMTYDVIFGEGAAEPSDEAICWLTKNFSIQLHQVPQLIHHAPIILIDGMHHEQASAYAKAGRALGLPVTAHPAGFGRFSVHVMDAPYLGAVAEVLRQTSTPIPDTFPAAVASDLNDLDARWMAHELELVGATVTFQEYP